MSLELWHSWDKGGRRPDSLGPLMTAYQPLVGREASRWSGSGLPQLALETHAKKLVIAGFHSFDPKRGVQLSTHLINQLRGMDRFVSTYRGDVRLPQEKLHLADKVFRTQQALSLELGREPTATEIGERSGIGTTTIGKLKKFQSGLYSQAESGGFSQPVREDISHDEIVMGFLYQELSPQEQLVFDYSAGQHGKIELQPGAIATKLNISAARVSQLKTGIATKAKRYQRAVGSLLEG
jgi:DNA-directed RNA polymerase sigma subunit (sigma70/sigma32)